MSLIDKKNCIGIHLTLLLCDLDPKNIFTKISIFFDFIFRKNIFNERENYFLEIMEGFYFIHFKLKHFYPEEFDEKELNYAKLQTTKPYSLSFSLSDSPSVNLIYFNSINRDYVDGYWKNSKIGVIVK
jgi:hypothetical protein